jgi:hypothetical protein
MRQRLRWLSKANPQHVVDRVPDIGTRSADEPEGIPVLAYRRRRLETE